MSLVPQIVSLATLNEKGKVSAQLHLLAAMVSGAPGDESCLRRSGKTMTPLWGERAIDGFGHIRNPPWSTSSLDLRTECSYTGIQGQGIRSCVEDLGLQGRMTDPVIIRPSLLKLP